MNDSVDIEELEADIKAAIMATFAEGKAPDGTVKSKMYKPDKIHEWATKVQERCLTSIKDRDSKLKAVVTCIIMQKTGASMHTTAATFWERNEGDLYCTVPWQNRFLHCVVTIYAMKAFPTIDADEEVAQ